MSNAMVLLTPDELRALVRDAVRQEIGAHDQVAAIPDVLTREQVADLLQIHKNVVSRYIRDKGLPTHRIGGEYRFRRNEVLAWLERQNGKA